MDVIPALLGHGAETGGLAVVRSIVMADEDVYLTSSPGCGRADAMHIVLAACADAVPCLTLAAGANGDPTFRL